MGPEAAIDLINADQPVKYSLVGRLAGGEDQGAYRVVDATGQNAILKLSNNPRWADQVKRGRAATDHLRPLGYPVPTYTYIGASDSGSFWLETELVGGPVIGAPTADQIKNILQLVEIQGGQVISEVQGQDWVWYISDVVFRGESGNVRALMQFSPATSAIVTAAEGLVAGLQGTVLPKTDLVHGNFNISQIFFTNDQVSGVLDWDQAGYGDRAIDLVGLWYSVVGTPEIADIVMQQLLAVSTKPAIYIYAVHKILAQLAWHINKVHGDVDEQTLQAQTAIKLLQAL
jgi:aminoglycoside phosphotransferase